MSEGTHADSAPIEGLVTQLAQESFAFDATSRDAERNCWLVVHRHAHGVLDLAVLAERSQLSV